jgi:CheY-like chemotaxis protein
MSKILFIEDESALQKAIEEVLTEKGYVIIKALNGEEGLEQARTEHPDLILLDLILPRKNGFEVLAELKQDETTKKIPVIVLTNLEGSEEVEKALALGAKTYLVKANYSLEEVCKKAEEAIAEKKE